MSLEDYSTTPANNSDAPPNGAPEGMAAASVNDTMRQMMADIKSGVAFTVDTIALLRGLDDTKVEAGVVAGVSGHTSIGDGGGGQFMWDAANTDADDGGKTIVPTSAPATGRWVRMLNGVTANPLMFGASGLGAGNNDLAAIQACITTYRDVEFVVPPVYYEVDNSTLTINVPSETKLSGYGKIKRTDDARPIFESIGTLTTPRTNVELSNLYIEADSSIDFGVTTGGTVNGAFRGAYIHGFRFTNNLLVNITGGVIASDGVASNLNFLAQPFIDYASITDDNMSRDIVIQGNICADNSTYDRAAVTGHVHCFYLVYCRDYSINDNIIRGYKAGIVVSGGQANNSTGAANNVSTFTFDLSDDSYLKSFNGEANNNVVDTTHVGIWCWTARDFLVSGNKINSPIAESCDVEASSRITFRGNKITGVKGQCLNSFYDNRDIVFENNDCQIDITGGLGDVFLNSLNDTGVATTKYNSVIIRNNRFITGGTVTTRSVSTLQPSLMREFIFENNICENVVVKDFGKHNKVSYKDNVFIQNDAIVAPFTVDVVLSLGAQLISTDAADDDNLVDVCNNQFIARGTAQGAKGAMQIGWSDNSVIYNIFNNDVMGYAYWFDMPSASCAALGASSSLNVFNLKHNIPNVTGGTPCFIQDNTTALSDTNILVHWEDNVGGDGYDLYGVKPNTGALNMYFSKGSKVTHKATNITAGGTEGFICTTSGHKTNSVFKDFGVIAV